MTAISFQGDGCLVWWGDKTQLGVLCHLVLGLGGKYGTSKDNNLVLPGTQSQIDHRQHFDG